MVLLKKFSIVVVKTIERTHMTTTTTVECKEFRTLLLINNLSQEDNRRLISSLFLKTLSRRNTATTTRLLSSKFIQNLILELYTKKLLSHITFKNIIFYGLLDMRTQFLFNFITSLKIVLREKDKIINTKDAKKLLERAFEISDLNVLSVYIDAVTKYFNPGGTIKLKEMVTQKNWRVVSILQTRGWDIQFTLKKNIPGLLQYSNNSCYIDSLLTVLFFTESVYWRRVLLTIPNNIKYTNPQLVCSVDSKIKTEKDLQLFTARVQKLLRGIFNQLKLREGVSCTNIREVLFECLTHLKGEDGKWDLFSVSELYTLFVELFPKLYLRYSTIIDKNLKTIAFEVSQYLTESIDRIEWENYSEPIFVLHNGGIPPYTLLNSIQQEYFKRKRLPSKVRALDENISLGENNYQLDGVIQLHGVKPGKAGGSHYTAYVRTKNGWAYYNDIGPKFEYLQNNILPSSVFTEEKGIKPEMFFYSKQ